MLAALRLELRNAARSLLRSPGFTLTAVAMLSIGLGLAIYMFGAIQSFLLREVPFPDGAGLLHIEYVDRSGRSDAIEPPTSDFLTLRRESRSFAQLDGFSQGTINLADDSTRPERYNGAFVSAGSFRTLGVEPFMGPGFQPGDDAAGAPAKVAIGYSLWQQRFNADPQIIGRAVRVNGRPASIVAVMPPGFAFPISNAVWAPLNLSGIDGPRRQQISLELFGRLTEGVTAEQASAEVETLLARIEQQDPAETLAERVVVKPYREEFVGRNTRQVLGTMFAAVLLVLAIACVNVANLMIARGVQRTRETAIRAAIGASRARLMVVCLSEALVIALAALLIGSVLAWLGGQATMEALRMSEDPPPYWMLEYRFDAVSAGFAVLAVGMVVLLAGLWPAWRAASAAQAEGMRQGGRVAGGRVGSSLTTLEIALCMVLLVTAGLTVRSVIERENLPQAFESAQVLGGRVGLFEGDYPDDNAVRDFAERLAPRLAGLPGVAAVGVTSAVPYSFAGGDLVDLGDASAGADAARPFSLVISADAGFFDALRLAPLHGRLFDARDRADALPVALVSEPLARQLWPEQNAVGQRLRLGQPGSEGAWIEVVGVVPHVPHVGDAPEMAALYRPFAQLPTRFFSPVVRSEGDPLALADGLRDSVAALDPNLPVYFLRTLEDWRRIAAFDQRLMAALFGIFGAFAVLLAAAGLYAVLAYQVGQRVREIGVRRALGADDRGIVRMVLRQGAWQLGLGVGIGLLLALGFAQLLSGVLFGVEPHDPTTFLAVATLLAVVSVLASLLPTRRALGVEPIVALRYD